MQGGARAPLTLDPVYPVVFFDALRVKIRDEGTVKNKAIYVALGLNPSGEKDVLGLWIEQTEGAKFWLKVMNDRKRFSDHTGRPDRLDEWSRSGREARSVLVGPGPRQ